MTRNFFALFRSFSLKPDQTQFCIDTIHNQAISVSDNILDFVRGNFFLVLLIEAVCAVSHRSRPYLKHHHVPKKTIQPTKPSFTHPLSTLHKVIPARPRMRNRILKRAPTARKHDAIRARRPSRIHIITLQNWKLIVRAGIG